jgi:DnaJ-class molecular chaperone
MKKFEGLNYYKILEIPVNSSSFDIRNAYRDTLEIYREDSMATYSLFSEDERENILDTIENAFLVLIDENKRTDYDKMLVDTGEIEPSVLTEKPEKKPKPIFLSEKSINQEDFFEKLNERAKEKDVKKVSDEIMSKELISGSDLRKLRKVLGLELDEIFKTIRISISMLEAIESNQFENLPSLIYLKNFLKSYAQVLCLDPQKVVDGYLINLTLLNSEG